MANFQRLTGVNDARVIEVIEIKSLAGEGTKDNPHREVTEYYSVKGELLARRDYSSNLDLGVWDGVAQESTKEQDGS